MTISSTKTLNWYLLTSLSHYASPQVWRVLGTGPTRSTNLNKNHLRERSALSGGAAGERWCCARGSRSPDTARLQHRGLPAVRAQSARWQSTFHRCRCSSGAQPWQTSSPRTGPPLHAPQVEYSHTARAATPQRWGCICASTRHASSAPSPHKEGNTPLQGAAPRAEHPHRQAGAIGELPPLHHDLPGVSSARAWVRVPSLAPNAHHEAAYKCTLQQTVNFIIKLNETGTVGGF